jgi:hypothetical protein
VKERRACQQDKARGRRDPLDGKKTRKRVGDDKKKLQAALPTKDERARTRGGEKCKERKKDGTCKQKKLE